MGTESEQVRILRENELLRAEIDRLEYALESIAKPSGAYSRDPAEYRKNVIDWCIETAKAALADSAREGDADVDPD